MVQNVDIDNEENTEGIDFIDILHTLIKGRKIIFIILFVTFIVGIFSAISTPNEYTSSTIFVPQGSDGKKMGGNIGGLAALAGINIGSGASDSGIPLSLYSSIINSIPYQKELVQTQITDSQNNNKISYKEYYSKLNKPGLLSNIKKYTIGLPSLIMDSFNKEKNNIKKQDSITQGIFYITKEEKNLFKLLKSQLTLKVNEKDNSVRLICIMANAENAAQMTFNAKKLLEEYIINFKIQKSSSKLDFIKKRYIEKEKEFKKQQQILASFQDRNRNLISSRSQARLTRLQSNFDLAFSVYNELAKQLETQQIQVKEDTPIFTTIKPVSVPVISSAPNRLIILLIWLFVGLIIGICIVLGKKYYSEFISKLRIENS